MSKIANKIENANAVRIVEKGVARGASIAEVYREGNRLTVPL
jgi:hypothetical protein